VFPTQSLDQVLPKIKFSQLNPKIKYFQRSSFPNSIPRSSTSQDQVFPTQSQDQINTYTIFVYSTLHQVSHTSVTCTIVSPEHNKTHVNKATIDKSPASISPCIPVKLSTEVLIIRLLNFS
ncbi:unnamed protein product, partial [Owenia fusiformis]